MSGFQDVADPSPTYDLIAQLQALGWVDKTSLVVLFAFFLMGLFKGLIWQVSRIAILITAYFVSGRYGHQVAEWIAGPRPAEAPTQPGVFGGAPSWPQDTTIYLSYCLLFVGVLLVLSLLTILIKKLADRAGLSFFDRLGGGVLGVATGSCVVLAGLMAIHMFFPNSSLAEAAQSSHSLRYSRQAISLLGTAVDDDLRKVLELAPLRAGDGHSNGHPGGQPGAEPFGEPLEDPHRDYHPPMPSPLPLPPSSTGEPQPAGRRGVR